MGIKVVSIVGARPQFIKLSAVSRAFKKFGIEEQIIHTGQHFDDNMSQVFFEEMQIPKPDYNLEINQMSHGAMTGRMLEKIEEILISLKPDFVLVFGDTNSTLAGALAAKKLQIQVIHVEAGLRSFTMAMPEEINRILTDRISDLLFCPTKTAVENLKNEGYDSLSASVINCGDVMLDSVNFYTVLANEKSTILRSLKLIDEDFFLCTIHRASNTNNEQTFSEIISALNKLAEKNKIVFPVHPRTRKLLEGVMMNPKILIIDPVGYFDMLQLLKGCRLVLTDSGGLQKEAYFFKKNCITLRQETEWTELVDNGYNILTGSDQNKIVEAVDSFNSQSATEFPAFYGDGTAGEIIAKAILLHKSSSM